MDNRENYLYLLFY